MTVKRKKVEDQKCIWSIES